ncbi:phage tail terminator protein [Desulfofustis limnaeus]|jgi:hypothetical protein|uniref:Tail terminator n=1 Tax=Desulfofustis limnaeus TaxID=2740163 RepID=A0ABM7W4T5_9BACT|nr:hypothetical protein [Desulfofustis limnaeus]BDD85928.1 hypothetical protein DPPLL_02930 [Desulfofustis limnaeus]BDD88871.1 hypothetical protein DPPLL_32360 [Desulfofustis limnaeus]
MAAVLSVAEQLAALIERIREQVPALKSVVGMEDLDEAMAAATRLPAAVVLFSGDYPQKPASSLQQHTGQLLNRYWSVIVILELTRTPAEGLDLVEQVNAAGVGWQPCRGVKYLTAAGTRFVEKFDKTRVVYEVRFATLTTL